MAISSRAIEIAGFCLWVSIFMLKGLNARDPVTYDGTSLIINGHRRLLISGSIHYPRSTPEMWPGLIDKAKDGGLDCIQTYVFWNLHEPKKGQYNFEGRLDLVRYLKLIQSKGLYVSLRIGPYIESEWNYGGLPYWLHDIPGIVFRTDNLAFKNEMQRFTTKIVDIMKNQRLFAGQGGPIIVAQIENEYGNVEAYFPRGHSYLEWAASMAMRLKIGVPWFMCKQPDAPNPIINTCNGPYCGDTFIGPNSNRKPKMWTEVNTGLFQVFGGSQPHRPVEDIAYAVGQFFAKKGTFLNYYMYHGGTNFGRSAGPFITTSYDYDAPIDEYGNLRQPKWGHLKDLHVAIKLCSNALLFGKPENFSLGLSQEAHVYRGRQGLCAAFLSNRDPSSNITVTFQNLTYKLPAWSISILPDCKNVAFNTAEVNIRSNSTTLISAQLKLGSSSTSLNENVEQSISWEAFKENFGDLGGALFQKRGLLEHISTTKDATDYLWYKISVGVKEDEPFLTSNAPPVLAIGSQGDAVHVFINNKFAGTANGNRANPAFMFQLPISLVSGENDIALLSVKVGLPNSGAYFERKTAGISKVILQGLKTGTRDLSQDLWTYQIGLLGEMSTIYSDHGLSRVNWTSSSSPNQSLTWYKTVIDAPDGDEPVTLDLSSMGKGQVWINGEHIGRYWISLLAPPGDCSKCQYEGLWNLHKCATKCGQPSQTLYHVPRSWMKPTGNLMVLFEETGGDPSKIPQLTRSMNNLCAHVSENHPRSIQSWKETKADSKMVGENVKPRLQLQCSVGRRISSIKFASFGKSHGVCGDFVKGTRRSVESEKAVEKVCVG